MDPDLASSSKSHIVDPEAQSRFHGHGKNLRSPSLDTTGFRRSTSSKRRAERPRVTSVNDSGDQDTTEMPHSVPQIDVSLPCDTLPPTDASAQPEWKPWKADDPLLTKVPKSETTMEDWVKAMEASDDGMCKGWRDQIDTLIIFAGLFSATVTAFTVESYQWLDETPADTLARLQLRTLLNATRDPAMDRLAPATFDVGFGSVVVNTLWFSSLTLSLAAVVISILCKQWLYEYQRYDNFTTNEAFLAHGLRHRGLQAWRVPEIISFLPIILQTALVLFLVGILVLLWPLQTVVVSITTIIVGLTFLFQSVTTALPSIQYIFPYFDTQCAYKSSQSWSFFIISAFWLFDFGEFTCWASFDQWEVNCVYNGTGFTLNRVYKLLYNNVDAVLGIYSFLADTCLKPTLNADLALLSDFVGQLDSSQQQFMLDPTDPNYEHSNRLRRTKQLKDSIGPFRHLFGRSRRLKPKLELEMYSWPSLHSTSPVKNIDHAYHSRMQSTLSDFLQTNRHISHPALFNRYIEHWARSVDVMQAGGMVQPPLDVYSAKIQYDPEIAMYLLLLHGQLLKTDWFDPFRASLLISRAYPSLMESYHQHKFYPPPFTLLKDIEKWINRVPKSDPQKKVSYILFWMAFENNCLKRFSEYHTSELEEQYLASFARFFVTLYEGGDFLAGREYLQSKEVESTLAFLRAYLDKYEKSTSGPTTSRTT